MSKAFEHAEKRIYEVATSIYRQPAERAAMRGALGDAAALLDALSRDVAAEHRGHGRHSPVTKKGLELEALVKRCADLLWLYREKIRGRREEDSTPQPTTTTRREEA